MIAGLVAAAYFTIYSRGLQAGCRRSIQEQVVDAQPGVA
jgi:hypothetical protein